MGNSCRSQNAASTISPNERAQAPTERYFLDAAGAGETHIDQKADANQVTPSGLHLACVREHYEMVRLLVNSKAELNATDCWGKQPLTDPTMYDHEDIMRILLQAGCVPSEEFQAQLEMKIFQLTSKNDLLGIKNMKENGWLSANAVDHYGRTALHLASQRGYLRIVEYLISVGADVNIKDNEGSTALCLAFAKDNKEVQRMLVGAGATSAKPLQSSNKAHENVLRNRTITASFALMEAFPQRIAVAMLEGRAIEPISKQCVSLLFSDIVGFTKLSSTMDPVKVSRLLSELFRKFDRLAYLHGVQKVDIIGDAYIAATNFSEDQPTDHAARLARFAVDIVAAARATPINEESPDEFGYVQLRVGMHCGPVSGSVVGHQVRKYTLFGDAVNIASRMESCGLGGRIQCSEASATLIIEQANDLLLRPRNGGIEAKGKGHMRTFWVSSVRRAGLCAHGSCPNMLRERPATTVSSAADDMDETRSTVSAQTGPVLPRSMSFTAAGRDSIIERLLSSSSLETGDSGSDLKAFAISDGGREVPISKALYSSGDEYGGPISNDDVSTQRFRPPCSSGSRIDSGADSGIVSMSSYFIGEAEHAEAAVAASGPPAPAGPGVGPEPSVAAKEPTWTAMKRTVSQNSLNSQSQIYRL